MATVLIAEKESSAASATRRRHRSKWERLQVVEETFKPGASVAVIARAHGVNANQVFHWRKLYKQGLLGGSVESTQLLPIRISEAPEAAVGSKIASVATGTIHIELSNARLRIEGAADPDSIRATLTTLESLRR